MANWADVFTEATNAADAAVEAEVRREPENMNAFDCGFAWVVVRPANHPFINWCKTQIKTENAAHVAIGGLPGRSPHVRQLGDKQYAGGWCFWKPGNFNGQSIRIHEKGSEAFAEVLRNHGLNAHASSRLD